MVPAPLPVVLPLLVAAGMTAAGRRLSRRAADLTSILTAGATTALCAGLVVQSAHHYVVYWFGGWKPEHGIALGIAFVVGPFGAGLAGLAALLITLAHVYSWRYFEAVGTLYHVLMLVFLAAMAGFCLSGDVFNMFVFFELMSVSAFALTGYLIEESGPLQGALNFAITVSVAAFLMLSGIGLLYGRTGALNLAQIGDALAGKKPDGLVIAAFVLVSSGLLVKSASVPFHFWLADVESVAPNPVCAVFSGAMVTLGVYGVGRVYWAVFEGSLGSHRAEVRGVLLGLGVVTALLGGVMSLLQSQLKRLLAFSTIAHVGIAIIGLSLLSPLATAGAALYALAHGTAKASLFLSTGVLAHRFGTVWEDELHGRARRLRLAAALFALGALALSGLPPFGTFLSKGLIDDAARQASLGWVGGVTALASALTGAAVLRFAAHAFLGWGVPERGAPSPHEEEAETRGERWRTPAVMAVPACALLVLSAAITFVPGIGRGAESVAARFQDRGVYASQVLHVPAPIPAHHHLEPASPSASAVESGLGSSVLAVLLAAALVGRRRLPRGLGTRLAHVLRPHSSLLHSVHSGLVGDYVAWLVFGVAALGGLFALALR